MNLSPHNVSSEEVLKTSPSFTTNHGRLPSKPIPDHTIEIPSTAKGPSYAPTASPSCSPYTLNATTSRQDGHSLLKVPTGMPSADAPVASVPWSPFVSTTTSARTPLDDKSPSGYFTTSRSVIGQQRPQTPPTSSSQPISVSAPSLWPTRVIGDGLPVPKPLGPSPGIASAPPLLVASSMPSLTLIGTNPSPSGATIPMPSPTYTTSFPPLSLVGNTLSSFLSPSSSSSKEDQGALRPLPTSNSIKIMIMSEDLPEEEKIDVCGVKDSLLLKQVEGGQDPVYKDPLNRGTNDDLRDVNNQDATSPLFSQLGSQCSRTVPGLMKFYSRHKRSLATSLSVNLSVSGQATPPCSPISPGTLTAFPSPMTTRSSLEASTMTSPTDRSHATPSDFLQIPLPHEQRDLPVVTSVASSPIAALTLLTVPELTQQPISESKLSSPTALKGKKGAKPGDKDTATLVSLDNSPAVTSVGSIPPGIPFPAPWQLPHNTIAHPGSFWIHPGQFPGVDASAGLGLGYHMTRDPLTGHLFLISRPHPIPDPSGHGIVWAEYGSVPPTPPVVMTPQQLLLDHRYRPAPLMHVHPPTIHPQQPAPVPPIKKEDSSSVLPKDDNTKAPVPLVDVPATHSTELGLPHFLYPPSSPPYYYTQATHPAPFSLPAFPPSNATLSLTTNLLTPLTSIPFTSASTTVTTIPFTSASTTVTTMATSSSTPPPSSSKGSVLPMPTGTWSRGVARSVSSPGLHQDPKHASSLDSLLPFTEPPMDLTQHSPSTNSPPGDVPTSRTSKFGPRRDDTHLSSRPLLIKREIKEEMISPYPEIANSAPPPPRIKAECNPPPGPIAVPVPDLPKADGDPGGVSSILAEKEIVPSLPHREFEEEPCPPCEDPHPTVERAGTIDSSGLELLCQTFLAHGERLAPSPHARDSDLESVWSQSDQQMPFLERAAKTPSPRCSPASFESQPPVLTPFTFPTQSPSLSSPEPPLTPPPLDLYLEPTLQPPPPKPSPLSVLCALVEQRIQEEEQQSNCSALSSLAEVASSTPSVPTELPTIQGLVEGESDGSQQVSPAKDISSVCPIPAPSASWVEDSLEPTHTSPEPGVSLKSPDINRNYKSPESERDARAFIANKASQYHKDVSGDIAALSTHPVDDMDAAEVDMRMKLADLQRQYREKQRELSRLQPKKETPPLSLKRGRGRPPKRKSLTPLTAGVKRKVGRPLKKLKLDKWLSDSEAKSADVSLKRHPGESAEGPEGPKEISPGEEVSAMVSSLDRWQIKVEQDSSDEDDSLLPSKTLISEDVSIPAFKPPSLAQETKQEESDEDQPSNEALSVDYSSKQTETSVESSTSDAEFHSTSSSKKRKPGRPKKHSPTKYDATETIVAKKPKTLGFLLLSHKTKIRPKLKAELKVRSDQEDDYGGHQGSATEQRPSEEDSEDLPAKGIPKIPRKCKNSLGGESLQRRGAPMGRTSLSRNTVLRDKEKRKSVFEKNSRMQELFRSLKRCSTIAAAEHDESEDEKDDKEEENEAQSKSGGDDNDVEETKPIPLMPPIAASECPNPSPEIKNLSAVNQEIEEIRIKSEPKATTNVDGASSNMTPVESTDTSDVSPGAGELLSPVKEEELIEHRQNSSSRNLCNIEKENSICSLQVEDLVRGARVMVLQDGLLYAGSLSPITPPDVYGIHIDGERGTRPHICCQEELLTQSWKEVKPGSTRFLTEGTRVCAFWSQQYRGLYPGCVAAASSPTHEGNHNLVNVEFDDGDSGRIHVDDIRLLPRDFPVVEHDPNPLMSLNKRKRRPTEEDHRDSKPTPPLPPLKSKKTRRQKRRVMSDQKREERQEDSKETRPKKGSVKEGQRETRRRKKVARSDAIISNLELRRGHKKRKRHNEMPSHRHKRKRKHKHRRKLSNQLFPHVEQGDSELKMRIKSPPPFKKESDSPSESSSENDSRQSENESYQPARRQKQKRNPYEKSKIAPFLLERQLWRWSGKGYRRPGSKGKGRKEFHKEIVRGKEHIRVGDCAVFLSSGSHERPFIGRIDFLWEAWGGNMVVKVRWFYHPDETVGTERKLAEPRGALFSSSHTDENDVQTISHKCHVVPLAEYRIRRAEVDRKRGPDYENYDLYYLAGYYDPTYTRITMEPGVS